MLPQSLEKRLRKRQQKQLWQQSRQHPRELNASEYVKLGQYEGLTIKGSSTKVTEQEIEDKIDELADEYTDYKEITSRDTVQKEDYLNIDYATTIDGKENEDYSDSSIDIHLGKET